MYDVVALGELLIDFTPKGVSEAGNSILHAIPGGAPGNFLAALTACGKKTAFIGKVGKDTFGTQIKKTLSDAGMDVSSVIEDASVFTTLAFVTLDEHGDRNFSFARKPGADMMLTPEELDTEKLTHTRVFHFGTISMTDDPARSATRSAIEIARKSGAWISFDPNYRPPLWKQEADAVEQMRWGVQHADVVKISEEELEMLYDGSLEDGAKWLLSDCGVKLVFLTCGKKGCYYCNRNVYDFSPSFIELPTIDTNGAGDIFGGTAMSKVLDSGKNPEDLTAAELAEICEFANAMAGLSTTKNGAIPSIPKPEEAYALMQQKN
ncbi:carbohydrate kinase family protein [Yeguia hominis]|uniref:Carbohydrate kinase n=1 Tax=Yeguia hominis TaxID=2763662 RepID=A0A926HR22_9FIRM|nr:carbohydrate kinase [Yeguia hominis]MBC8533314.1 carbohydrate kinase [Yeguia hominis]